MIPKGLVWRLSMVEVTQTSHERLHQQDSAESSVMHKKGTGGECGEGKQAEDLQWELTVKHTSSEVLSE